MTDAVPSTETAAAVEHTFDDDAHTAQTAHGGVAHFFEHYWPLMIFTMFFVLMMVFPLVFASAEGATYRQLPLSALYIVLAFAMGLLLTWFAPRLMGVYLVVLTAGVFFINQPAFEWMDSGMAGNHANGPYLTLICLGFSIVGTIFMLMPHAKPTD